MSTEHNIDFFSGILSKANSFSSYITSSSRTTKRNVLQHGLNGGCLETEDVENEKNRQIPLVMKK